MCLYFNTCYTQARTILERHLVIADKAFTMAALRSMANESIVLPTIRDALTIRVREEGKRKYSIEINCDKRLVWVTQAFRYKGTNHAKCFSITLNIFSSTRIDSAKQFKNKFHFQLCLSCFFSQFITFFPDKSCTCEYEYFKYRDHENNKTFSYHIRDIFPRR